MVGSTGLGLACMVSSAAAMQISKADGLQFRWHWSILLFAVAVIIWNSRFWRVIWDLQQGERESSRRKLVIHLGILSLLGIVSFLYPIRFVEQSYWSGILRGLVTAVLFLGVMLWLIYKCGKGFLEIDAIEAKRQTNVARNKEENCHGLGDGTKAVAYR